ncbi:sulfotransferase 1A1-like [Haliotis asinina]|uniref:sulfotransferase 1A1-like n=1 Tax=Haliotis asinina TaxID=109174 RepID=UPI0035326FCE
MYTVVRLLVVLGALGLAPSDLLAQMRRVPRFSTGSTALLTLWRHLVDAQDDGGDTLTFLNDNGFFIPNFPDGQVMYESWMDYVLDWELVKKTNPDQPVLTLFYEDIKQDQMREMRKICEFLGVERTDDFLSKVCDNTIAAMRTHKNKGHDRSSVFRKGGVGDWKNWFTVAQNEWFDQFYQEKMAGCPLQFTYTL